MSALPCVKLADTTTKFWRYLVVGVEWNVCMHCLLVCYCVFGFSIAVLGYHVLFMQSSTLLACECHWTFVIPNKAHQTFSTSVGVLVLFSTEQNLQV